MKVTVFSNGSISQRDATDAEARVNAGIDAGFAGNETPTPEERIAALEVLTDDIVLFMADLIGG